MKICTACNGEYADDVLFCQRDGTPLRPSAATGDLVGQVIADRYHIQKKLGEGGMGQVYLAEHVKMGRRCAIKIMSPGSMSDPDAISRFNREAANASRISHPNVCSIYDFGETPEGLIYLAMEFIEGQSLSALLDDTGALPVPRAAEMVVQTAEALQVAHDFGIVHRDLKPDNIMVITARGKDTVKVVDFGIAKAAGADGGAQKVTRTGFVVGTPEYMSPEQLAGDPVDGRSDLYSLGLVFYRMLTGKTPFPADSQQETMIKRLTDDPLPLKTARPEAHFPPELQRVMDRILARDPAQRYATAAEFAKEVRRVASSVTGKVDVEAGTQVVKAEELKAAVPATRVDPAAGRPKPASAPAPSAVQKKATPIVPIAAVVTLLALAGGGYLFRGKLLGTAAPTDSTQLQAHTPVESTAVKPDTGVTPLRGPDTTSQGATSDPGRTVPTNPNTNPGNGRPTGGKDSTSRAVTPPRVDVAALGRDLKPYYDELEWLDDDATRLAGYTLATRVYQTSGADNELKGHAAFVLYQVKLQEKSMTDARRWLDKAIELEPNNVSYVNQRQRIFP